MSNIVEEILAYFDYIRANRRSINIASEYQGVSYSIDVLIANVHRKGGGIVVGNRERKNISVFPNTDVIIRNDLFPNPIQARVNAVDNKRRLAYLKDFHYLRNPTENRTHVRVTPRQEIVVTINKDGLWRLTGKVIDLSIDGLSLMIDDSVITQEKLLSSNDSVRLSFHIPDEKKTSQYTFNFPAKIVYSNPKNKDNLYRVGLQIFPTTEETSMLRQYVFDRQTEILKEAR